MANSTVWRSSDNWDNGVPTSFLTTRISVTNLDPYVPVPLDGDTARTGSLEIQESGYLYFDSTGILIIHGSELKIQNLGTINLGYGKLIAKNNITFFNGGTFLAETGVLEFSGVTWENKAGQRSIPVPAQSFSTEADHKRSLSTTLPIFHSITYRSPQEAPLLLTVISS